ncbi:alpha/beta fold hydrolase [Dactylosporangium sp. CS-047395]|uniref:alpha/beta fold hydrolase n=1 Tax=Dactylosporangium sp. CS-047395 TaxID=3239936 RepID=UPI003D8BDE9F
MKMSFEHENGTIAYDDTQADGPLVLCLPGMGVNRRTYAPFVPELTARGYRVVTMDLRGQGESSAVWSDYSAQAVARDAIALLRRLNAGPAVLFTNSYTGATAVWAAAEAPELFTAVILSNPFARVMPKPNLVMRAATVALSRVRPLWIAYWASLYKTKKADPAEKRALSGSLKEPGRMAAMRAMMQSDASVCEARMGEVRTPVLVLMGEKDPDFPDPAAEGRLLAERLRGETTVIARAGHYPHAELPGETADAVVAFLRERAVA